MQHEILYQPAFSLLTVTLHTAESVKAEAGAMVSMASGIRMETQAAGGIMGGLKRKLLGGESFFVNTFTASQPGEVQFAPTLPGDIFALHLEGNTVLAQSGAYIASAPEIHVDTQWGGAKTFFSKEGLFLLKMSGAGPLFLGSYGAVHMIELQAGEMRVVDTGHMVAFDESVQYNVKTVGGLKSTLFSGEGLVCELTGPGRIWIQSRSWDSFLSWLIPQIPGRGS